MVGAATTEGLWRQAEQQLAQNSADAAQASLEAILVRDPDHVMARLRLSTLATAQGRYRDCVAQLLAVCERQPSDPYLLAMLAGMLHRLGETRVALACVAHPALAAATDRALLQEMAQLASQMEDIETATRLLASADRLGPATSASLYTAASLQLFGGELDRAERTLEACLALAPRHAQAHWALSRVRRQTPQHNHVARLQRTLAEQPDAASAAYLCFALFKEMDDLDRPDEAWQALASGCAAKRGQLSYRADEEQAAFDALHRVRGPATPSVGAPSSDTPTPDTPAPIFIVGMPRTGTTLLERILGRDPQVRNVGELDDLPLQLRWIADRFSKSYLDPAVLGAIGEGALAQLGRRYLEHASWRAGGKAFFTDKMPLNFLHCGLIAKALPQARILHMTRNPMDTCFSNLKELFTEVYPYSYDQQEVAAHYGRYRRLMAHWHEQFPGRVLDVSYEQLVADPEASSRAIFDFCGLSWTPQVLEIERSASAVTTASSVQVRERIHGRGVEAWRKYAHHLQPLRHRLQADGWLAE